jgi:choline dehydrogenase-like flavoprotein
MDTPLANPIGDLKDSYGVVVIGSGYGGAILAARLAQGRSLCILERGREWIPGTFPDELDEVVRQVRSELNPLGLYDYRVHDEVDVLIGCGLGGTSLINANVVIQPDNDLFDHPRWPDEIRQDRDNGNLNQYFPRVRAMLGLGIGHKAGVEQGHGVVFDKPLRRMREYVAIIRAILRGENIPETTVCPVKRFRLEFTPERATLPI